MNSTHDEFGAQGPPPTPTRGRPTGRRPGDSGTREAILRAARRQFAELGYDRTSLRGIAQEAGVDPTLVSHFHGSKQQLFVAVVELPFRPAEVMPVLLGGDPARVGERVAGFLLGILESEDGRGRVIGLLRAAATDPDAARMVREVIITQLFTPMAEHLGADRPRLRASFVGAQVVGLAMARYMVGVEPLASLDAATVAAILAPNLQRLLVDPLPVADASRP
jgi:AcrR family transcriptional regulator